MDRRGFLRAGLTAASVVALGPAAWRAIATGGPTPGPSPYGTLLPANGHGIRLPAGFTSRVIGQALEPVGDTGYQWHWYPDGGATFAVPDGGWVYVSNSELAGAGGASAVRFEPDGTIADAYRILANTTDNCAGGATPWGTWLSCEEQPYGRVWECDPLGVGVAVPRHLLGQFNHEAAVVDPVTGFVYLTEDRGDGCFYRFRSALPYPGPIPQAFPADILTAGTLEVAVVTGATVEWVPLDSPLVVAVGDGEYTTPTREQVPGAARFNRGEGAFFDAAARTVYFCATGDNTIWAHDVDAGTIDVLFSSAGTPGSPLNGADNITVSPGGEVFVCEDHNASGGPLQMVLIALDEGVVAPFLELDARHDGSEITGVAFDPAGARMYFSSQRAQGLGVTYEVRGPFSV